MHNRARVPLLLLSVFFCSFVLPITMHARTLNVNCNGSGDDGPATITGALKFLDPEGPNTINVSGSCKENVLIQGFGRLTLNANPGASINDASGGAGNVVDIEDSTDVAIQGFTISGGDVGVFCGDLSVCRFKNNTIQNATASVTGDGVGVWVGRSRATFDGDAIQNNENRGLNVVNGSAARGVNIQVSHNGAFGVFVGSGSLFTGDPATIQNNGVAGVRVATHSTFNLLAGTITGNATNGVRVGNASEASIQSFDGAISISNNGGPGVQIDDLSFVLFQNGGTADLALTVTGNSDPQVVCNPQFSATRGVFSDVTPQPITTNCTEP